MKRSWAIGIITGVLVALVGVIIFAVVRPSEAWRKHDPGEQVHDDTRYISIDGKGYPCVEGLETVMFVGLDDKYGDLEMNDQARSDYVSIILLNHEEKTFSVLHLDNSTLCDIPVLDEQGKLENWTPGQLYLSHTYGEGGKSSTKNVRRTVKKLLYDAPIDHYFTIYIDAMPVLNDAVNGVTVDIKDDFRGSTDPATGKAVPGSGEMVPGARVHLTGEQAKLYVRKLYDADGNSKYRTSNDDNQLRRMERQNQYMEEWIKVAPEALEKNPESVTDALVEISDYLTSDMSIYVLADMIEAATTYEMKEIVTPEGEVKTNGLRADTTVHGTAGDTVTFVPDDDKLKELVIRLFCDVE